MQYEANGVMEVANTVKQKQSIKRAGVASMLGIGLLSGLMAYEIEARRDAHNSRIATCMNEKNGAMIADRDLVNILRGTDPKELTVPYFDLYKAMKKCEK